LIATEQVKSRVAWGFSQFFKKNFHT